METIGIIGSGMIGISLAALFTGNGYSTLLFVRNAAKIELCQVRYDAIFGQLEAHGRLTRTEATVCSSYLKIVNDYRDLSEAAYVFECIAEDLAAKHDVLVSLERHCPDVRVIASTTSALSADDVVTGLTELRGRFIVAHPFNPPHLVPCVEVVRGTQTTDETVKAVVSLLQSVGRVVTILNRNVPGFIGNRLQYALLREAMYLIDTGVATAADIDTILQNSLMPRYTAIGLFEHQDNAGLDLIKKVGEYLLPALNNDTRFPIWLLDKVEAGDLGVKTGRGVYEWDAERVFDLNERILEPFEVHWQIPKSSFNDL